MVDVLLTSEDYIKTNSGLDDNVWGKMLLPAMREAQEIGLQSIIGSRLYEALMDKVRNDEIADDDDYRDLLDAFVQPYLMYKTIVDLIPVISVKISNIGTIIGNEEKVLSISKNERDLLADYYQYRADFYCRRMQEFLCDNRKLYKELNANDCKRMKANLTSAATTNIWLGGARGR